MPANCTHKRVAVWRKLLAYQHCDRQQQNRVGKNYVIFLWLTADIFFSLNVFVVDHLFYCAVQFFWIVKLLPPECMLNDSFYANFKVITVLTLVMGFLRKKSLYCTQSSCWSSKLRESTRHEEFRGIVLVISSIKSARWSEIVLMRKNFSLPKNSKNYIKVPSLNYFLPFSLIQNNL